MCFPDDFMQAAKDFSEYEIATEPLDLMDDEENDEYEDEDGEGGE